MINAIIQALPAVLNVANSLKGGSKTSSNSSSGGDGLSFGKLLGLMGIQSGISILGGLLDKPEFNSFKGTSADPVQALGGALGKGNDLYATLLEKSKNPTKLRTLAQGNRGKGWATDPRLNMGSAPSAPLAGPAPVDLPLGDLPYPLPSRVNRRQL